MAGQITLSFLILALLLNVAVWIARSSAELHAEPVAFMTGLLVGVTWAFVLWALPQMRRR